jgi:hypothetical protein
MLWEMRRAIMEMMNYKVCAVIGMAVATMSCAAPKATVVAEAPLEKKVKAPEPEATVTAEPTLPVDDGLRMPDMLAMPQEGEFRSTNPNAPKTVNPSGAVISRPPTDPPSRVKAKAD